MKTCLCATMVWTIKLKLGRYKFDLPIKVIVAFTKLFLLIQTDRKIMLQNYFSSCFRHLSTNKQKKLSKSNSRMMIRNWRRLAHIIMYFSIIYSLRNNKNSIPICNKVSKYCFDGKIPCQECSTLFDQYNTECKLR